MNQCAAEECVSNEDERIWFCERCDCFLCDRHWAQPIPHKPGRVSRNGVVHEKIDKRLKDLLEPIFNAPTDPKVRDELLQEDATSIWFAFHHDEKSGTNYLQNYDTYATLMQDSLSVDVPCRYPQLVSFIGETGVGKSSLIKLLIDLPEMNAAQEQRHKNASPVVGSVNENLPTTSSVHLYSDPATAATSRPLLFVDMEGLRGGESKPTSENVRSDTSSLGSGSGTDYRPSGIRYEVKERIRGSRPIRWATDADKQKREFTVGSLYPRFLYTFSDVVVFVVQGFRSFQSVVVLLLEWAAKSLETSVNQPLMPHAIIASNFTDNMIDAEQWDVEKATDKLLRDFESVVHQVPEFRDRKNFWESRGGPRIKTVKDLILRYYSSISVIRIPHKERFTRVGEQVTRLRGEIQKRCDQSFENKSALRFTLDSDILQTYLIAGFDHFSTHLDDPFNFLEVAVRMKPISRDFSGNILQLAMDMSRRSKSNLMTDTPGVIFSQMKEIVSSCIILDLIRKHRPGRVQEAFQKYYREFCDQAMKRFVSHFWPCSYEGCANVQVFHQKGHQSKNGKVIAAGDYSGNFDVEAYLPRWHSQLEKTLVDIERKLRHASGSNTDILAREAFSLHTKLIREYYEGIGGAEIYKNHTACLCCLLSAFPEHPLPCGHVICAQCVSAHGEKDPRGKITLRNCPLHRRKADWVKPFRIQTKPPLAGVSVLSLDGGGARGIVMLETLNALRYELPEGIDPQKFFDLIVGTSTGGLIALGLGVKQWSIDDAIEHFSNLVQKAFTRQAALGGPAALLLHGSIYKTQPLIEALRQSLGDENLFGGPTDRESPTRVAVTATTATGQRPVLLTNYNRRHSGLFHPDYQMERPQDADDELSLWQVGRATSAAPTIFKPYMHEATGRAFLDGALYYKCPARVANLERMMIWPDTIEHSPDVFLSLGTGQDHGKKWRQPSFADSATSTSILQNPSMELFGFERPSGTLGQRRKLPGLRKVVKDFMNNTMNAERMWNNFRSELLTMQSHTDRRWFRINPIFADGVLPMMDQADRVSDLHFHTRRTLGHEKMKGKIREIAHRLIASSFFFHKVSHHVDKSGLHCEGAIYCKFLDGTPEVLSLAEWLYTHNLDSGFEPRFEIYTSSRLGIVQTFQLSKKVLQAMGNGRCSFKISVTIDMGEENSKTYITLVLGENQRYPISGFPAVLVSKPPDSQLHSSDEEVASRSSFDTQSLMSEPALATTRATETYTATPQKHGRSRLKSFLSFKGNEDGKIQINLPQRFEKLSPGTLEIFVGSFEQTPLIDGVLAKPTSPIMSGPKTALRAHFWSTNKSKLNDSPFDSDDEEDKLPNKAGSPNLKGLNIDVKASEWSNDMQAYVKSQFESDKSKPNNE